MVTKIQEYTSTLYIKSDDELKPHLLGKKDEYLTRYESYNYKFFITQDSLNSEGVYIINIAKKQVDGKFKLLTVLDVMNDNLEFVSHLTNFLNEYINKNQLFNFFYTWIPPIAKNQYHEYFLDLSDVFYIEIQVPRDGTPNCYDYNNNRGERFQISIYYNPNTKYGKTGDIDYAFITFQKYNDLYKNICEKFFPDDRNKKLTSIFTIDDSQLPGRNMKYNDYMYCHISKLLSTK